MEPILRNAQNIDWITLVIFGSLLLVTIAKITFYNRFMNFIALPINNKYLYIYNKKEKLGNWFHFFLSIFQTINFSLFIFFSWKILYANETHSLSLFAYPIILGAVTLFLLFKTLLQLGSGFIFSNNKTISELVFKKSSYLNHSGIIMFLANIVLAYVLKDSKIIIYMTFFLILVINGIGWATLLRTHQKYIVGNFIYFILYLCALEIAPLVILGSYLNDSTL